MSTVEYLNPETETWVQRTAEDTLDLVADPFWRIKQSSIASKDAIILRCGLGFIKRSTDGGENWSDITPGTNPPNDAGDSPAPTVGTATFSQLDGSVSTQDEFVVLVTWQNSSSLWRSWVAFTDDNGATWSWSAGIPAQTPGYTEYGIDYILDATYAGKYAWAFNLTGDGDTGSFIAINDDEIYLCSYNGTSEPTVEDIANPGGNIRSVLRLSSTRFAVITQVTYITMRLYGVGGGYTTLTELDSDSLPSRYEETGGNTGRIGFWGIDSPTKSIFYVTRWGSQQGDIGRVTFISDTIAWPSGQTAWRPWYALPPAQKRGHYFLGNAVVSALNSVVAIWQVAEIVEFQDKTQIHATVFDYNAAGNPTFGSDYTIDSTWFVNPNTDDRNPRDCVVRLSFDPTFLVTWANLSVRSCVGLSISGTVITAGTPANIGPRYWPNPVRVSDSEAFVVGNRYASLISIDGSLDATEIEGGSTLSGDANSSSAKTSAALALNTPGLMAQVWITNSGIWGGPGTVIGFFEVVSGGGDGGDEEVKALGISLGKGLGNKAWVTLWNNASGLSLIDIAIPAMTISGRYALGSASLAAVGGKALIAYPYAAFGNDNYVVVFGRMAAPQGLSTPEHIIYTDDGGASFVSVENAWDVDHCGALLVTLDGIMIGVRNRGIQAKLYMDENDFNMQVKMTMPFDNNVQPHGLAYDFVGGTVYVCSGDADSYMIFRINPPYVSEQNITYNHGNAEGVNAIAIL